MATETSEQTMQARAIARHVRMSPRKVRLVVDQIRGKSVNQAYQILQFSPKAAAEPISKTLRSAVANAQYKAQESGAVLDVDDLVVSSVYVDEGPTLKRYRAAAMGRAAPIRKRTSHITVAVDLKDA
jgi:large subunit ribosomal protein L22